MSTRALGSGFRISWLSAQEAVTLHQASVGKHSCLLLLQSGVLGLRVRDLKMKVPGRLLGHGRMMYLVLRTSHIR